MSSELIKVTVQNDQQLISARDLHKGLGLKRQFTDWWKQNSKDFENGTDYTSTLTSVNVGNGAIREVQDYALTIDMAKQLCLLSRTKKGKEYREYLIEIEKKWNDPQNVVKRAIDILHSENLQLKLENKSLSRQLEESNKKASRLLGINSDTLAKYERGEREPRLKTWQKLANFWEVSVPYLQGLDQEWYRAECLECGKVFRILSKEADEVNCCPFCKKFYFSMSKAN